MELEVRNWELEGRASPPPFLASSSQLRAPTSDSMSDFARVESIDALRDFRAALWKFAEVAQVALGDAESELSRTLMWLENEQTSYWAGQVRKRHAAVTAAVEKLREKKLFKD